MLLLAAVNEGQSHGYAIVEHLRDATSGSFDFADGTIYPALRRLERSGYLRSKWIENEGRRKRRYQLTPQGKRLLARQKQEWGIFEQGVRAILGFNRLDEESARPVSS